MTKLIAFLLIFSTFAFANVSGNWKGKVVWTDNDGTTVSTVETIDLVEQVDNKLKVALFGVWLETTLKIENKSELWFDGKKVGLLTTTGFQLVGFEIEGISIDFTAEIQADYSLVIKFRYLDMASKYLVNATGTLQLLEDQSSSNRFL